MDGGDEGCVTYQHLHRLILINIIDGLDGWLGQGRQLQRVHALDG